MGKLADVNASLQEVTDHLLLVLSERGEPEEPADPLRSLLDSLPDLVVQLDSEGFVTYTNAASLGIPVNPGEPFEWSVHKSDTDLLRDQIRQGFEQGLTDPFEIRIGGLAYQARAKAQAGASELALVLRAC
jgi:PAS domain-containing protein